MDISFYQHDDFVNLQHIRLPLTIPLLTIFLQQKTSFFQLNTTPVLCTQNLPLPKPPTKYSLPVIITLLRTLFYTLSCHNQHFFQTKGLLFYRFYFFTRLFFCEVIAYTLLVLNIYILPMCLYYDYLVSYFPIFSAQHHHLYNSVLTLYYIHTTNTTSVYTTVIYSVT